MADKKLKMQDESSLLIFACSGAADVGNIADLTARRLTGAGFGKMLCLAGIGGGVEPILSTTEKASFLLAIDGCQLDCARKSLEKSGFPDVAHIRITDLGMKKGSTSPSEKNIGVVQKQAESLLNQKK